MVELLLLIICCYVAAAMSVHLAYWLLSRRLRPSKHYVLVAGNEQKKIEWYMRSFYVFSKSTGTDVKLTLIDHGASDETLDIAEKLARLGTGITVRKAKHRGDPSGEQAFGHLLEEPDHLMWMLQAEGIVSNADHAVLVDLRNPNDLSKMPF
ncbi:hypothetical protein ACFO9Q_13585 [Paenibacillus sp. GCM10023252]|uniref:hypothetical protein n=1 Tax=Paenibacillus sp. GCM10023252 TaxID=3252649 RepID=UPI00361A0D92